MSNIDPQEIQNFNDHASQWWDKTGAFKTLHDINPLRMQFILQAVDLENKKILDVGCGGGILSESLAWQGGDVIGIDAADKAITVAKQHAAESPELKLHYEHITVEEMLEKHTEKHVEKHAENSISTENGDPDGMDAEFDILTCMEMLEHIPDPAKLV